MISTALVIAKNEVVRYRNAKLVEMAFPRCHLLFASSFGRAMEVLLNLERCDLILTETDLGDCSAFDLVNLTFSEPVPILISDCGEHEYLAYERFGLPLKRLEIGFTVNDLRRAMREVDEGDELSEQVDLYV